MARAIVALFGLVIILGAGTLAMHAGFVNAGEDQTVVNESFTPGSGGVVTLDESNNRNAFYAPDNETTVYNGSDVEMEEGTDYEWIQKNGTVDVLSGGDLAGSGSSNITYSFQETNEEQRQWADVFGSINRGLGLIIPVLGFVLLLLLIKE